MKVLSLFTGAGGFDLGLEAAGFHIVGAVEQDQSCRQTLTLNRPNWPLAKKGDIHAYSSKALRKEFGIRRRSLELLTAGPPCQPFQRRAIG